MEMSPSGARGRARTAATVWCESTKGRIKIEVHPSWAPEGAKRFLELVENGYYSDIALFRVNRWIVQFGAVKTDRPGEWREKLIPEGRHHIPTIPDDPFTDCDGKCTKGSLFDGALSFAGGGKDSRTDQVFIVHHRGKSQPLGQSPWEIPIGNVTVGLDSVVKSWFSGYGDSGVSQVKIFNKGNEWVRREFPNLDFLIRCEREKKVSVAPTAIPHQQRLGLEKPERHEVKVHLASCVCLFGIVFFLALIFKPKLKSRKK